MRCRFLSPTDRAVLVPRAVRRCSASRSDGQPCGATPLRDAPFCFVHDPGSVELAIEARHLGGLRRRREKTVKRVYDVTGVGSIPELQRYVEVAMAEILALENSVPGTGACSTRSRPPSWSSRRASWPTRSGPCGPRSAG